jgi:hypothetical protein
MVRCWRLPLTYGFVSVIGFRIRRAALPKAARSHHRTSPIIDASGLDLPRLGLLQRSIEGDVPQGSQESREISVTLSI